MSEETTIRLRLADAESSVEKATAELHKAEGKRDALVLQLADSDGADSGRFAGVR